jgi:hypothetical protein
MRLCGRVYQGGKHRFHIGGGKALRVSLAPHAGNPVASTLHEPSGLTMLNPTQKARLTVLRSPLGELNCP